MHTIGAVPWLFQRLHTCHDRCDDATDVMAGQTTCSERKERKKGGISEESLIQIEFQGAMVTKDGHVLLGSYCESSNSGADVWRGFGEMTLFETLDGK